MNPSSGFFALSNSLGTTTLNLYSFSSILLASSFLLKNDTLVLAPNDAIPPEANPFYIPLAAFVWIYQLPFAESN